MSGFNALNNLTGIIQDPWNIKNHTEIFIKKKVIQPNLTLLKTTWIYSSIDKMNLFLQTVEMKNGIQALSEIDFENEGLSSY